MVDAVFRYVVVDLAAAVEALPLSWAHFHNREKKPTLARAEVDPFFTTLGGGDRGPDIFFSRGNLEPVVPAYPTAYLCWLGGVPRARGFLSLFFFFGG